MQARADELPQTQISVALAKITTVASSLAARLVLGTIPAHEPAGLPPRDRLLTIDEAAEKLGGVKKGWLYRHSARLPFTVRVSPRRLRFSELGIDKYIVQRRAS